MPFAPHVRLTALGELGGSGGEFFSYGINLMYGGDQYPGFTPNNTAWQDMADDVAAFHARPATKIAAFAVLKTVKFAAIQSDGSYAADPIMFAYSTAGGGGGTYVDSAQRTMTGTPPQSALAVSLETDRRGPSGKGRFYIPAPAIAVEPSNGFKMTVADAEGIRGSAVTFLNDVANNPGFDVVDLVPCVASTKGFNTVVTAVRVGRVLDTIRSRRGALSESYTAEQSVSFDA